MSRMLLALLALYALLLVPAARADSAACASLQTCTDSEVPTLLATCATANPTCSVTSTDKFALSAGTLATRTEKARHCDTKTFKTRGACNACYLSARALLSNRYDYQLFHGLLGQASALLEIARKARCNSITKK